MTKKTCYIAGDWGTSNLRLYLIDSASGQCLAQRSGLGVSQLERSQIPELLAELTVDWQRSQTVEVMILCGMVGSTIGWHDASYADCPLTLTNLADNLYAVADTNLPTYGTDLPTYIVPGIRCTSPTGAKDIMRGEETQLLGALQSKPELAKGRHLLCLPGTHSKWAVLQDGLVENFLTSLSGELFAILKAHSILTRDDENADTDETQFLAGVKRGAENPNTDLLHLLFDTRSRQISGELPPTKSASFLSGLIIGRDIQSAMHLFGSQNSSSQNSISIYFVANPALNHLYCLACSCLGIEGYALNGDQLSRMGIHALRPVLQNNRGA